MGAARNELEVRLDETFAAAHFMDRAYRLRPRIGHAIRWDGPAHEVELLRAFLVDDLSREGEILSALYVRSVATFERYLRKVSSEIVEAKAASASTLGALPPDFKLRHLVLSARLLGSMDQPKDYISFNPQIVIERLAACERDALPYQLNTVSFSASLQSPTVEAIERLLATLGIKDIFESIGRSTTLQRLLEKHGTRATGNRVQERLGEIVRWRNNFAHGGDDERTVSLDEFDAVVKFLRAVAIEIDETVDKSI